MLTIDWIFIGVIAASALIGMMAGFGKTVSLLTGGIFGVIMCAVAALMVGGVFKNIDFVAQFIVDIDAFFVSKWDFLQYLKLGTVCYYVILFVILQIVRLVIVRLLKQMDKSTSVVMRGINKAVGAVFAATFMMALALVLLAAVKSFSGFGISQTILEQIGDGFIHTLYENNPIKFVV